MQYIIQEAVGLSISALSLVMDSDSRPVWGGALACGCGAILYLLSNQCGRDAEKLKAVQRISRVKEIGGLLKAPRDRILPVLVAVAGRVGSLAPINVQGQHCVILETTEEKYYLKHDSGTWSQDSKILRPKHRDTPWYLDDGTGKVHLAASASGLVSGTDLTVASEVFEEPRTSVWQDAIDLMQGIKMLGVKKVVRVLPVGTKLTAVGEIVKDDSGALRMQRPAKGPFYITQKSLDELIGALGSWSLTWRWLSLGATSMGIFMLASHAVKCIFKSRRREDDSSSRLIDPRESAIPRREAPGVEPSHEEQSAPPVSESSRGDSSTRPTAEGSVEENVTANECVLCYQQKYNAVFIPCGHMCCCTECTARLRDCPLCRQHIEKVVKVYQH